MDFAGTSVPRASPAATVSASALPDQGRVPAYARILRMIIITVHIAGTSVLPGNPAPKECAALRHKQNAPGDAPIQGMMTRTAERVEIPALPINIAPVACAALSVNPTATGYARIL